MRVYNKKLIVITSDIFEPNIQLCRYKYYFTLFFICITILGCSDKETKQGLDRLPQAAKEYLKTYQKPDRLWGFLDMHQQVALPPQYDHAGNFINGVCIVNVDGCWFYIDKSGNKLSPDFYRSAYPFNDGFARVQFWDGRFNFLDSNFQLLLDTPVYLAKDFQGNHAVIQKKANLPFQILKKDGTILTDFEAYYEDQQVIELSSMNDSIITVKLYQKVILYNLNSQKYVGELFDKISPGQQNNFIVKNDGKYAIVDYSNQQVTHKDFTQLTYESDGIYTGIKNNMATVIINDQEYNVPHVTYLKYGGDSTFIYYDHNGKQGIMNIHLEKVTPPIYKQIYAFNNGKAAYMRNRLWGFLDKTGKELTPPQYGLVWSFNEGYSRVMFREGVGIIDENFRVVTPPNFGELRDYHDSLIAFRKNVF